MRVKRRVSAGSMAVSYERLLDEVQQATEDFQAIENAVIDDTAEVDPTKLQLDDAEKATLAGLGKRLEEVSRVLLRMEEQKMALQLDITSEESYEQARGAVMQQENTISTMNEKILQAQSSISAKQKLLEEAVENLSKARSQVIIPEEESQVPKDVLQFTEQMVLALRNFTGISVERVAEGGFTVATTHLKIHLDLIAQKGCARVSGVRVDENDLTQAKYAPFNQKAIQHLVEEGIKRNDIVLLVHELEAFYMNRKALNEELTEIAKHFPLSIVKREVVITLPEGVVLTVHVTDDYPGLPGDRAAQAKLVELDSLNGSKQSDADRVKAKYLETFDKRIPTVKHIVQDIMALLK